MGAAAGAKYVGRYELISELGRGGMASLYLGRLRGIGGFSKLVAVKQMLPQLSQDRKFVELFLNEGRIAARMAHPNLCQVFELGESDGELYLVMEYLEGVTWETLCRALPDDPDVVMRATASVIAQACEGMHYAHELRNADGTPSPVVHRDISPQNLFVTVDGTCKILDFGVAKMVTEVTQTRSGVLKGKLPYMSPEQIRGERLDGRSDVFALGIVLWEALVRDALFMRDTEFLIWKSILDEPIPTVTSRAPHYPASVDAIVMRALARDLAARYPSARELGQELRALAGTLGGAYTQVELAELVRTRCAPQLEERARQISEMTTHAQQAAHLSEDTRVDRPARAATTRVGLRDHSHVVEGGRSRRRGVVIGLGVGALAIGGLVAVRSQLGQRDAAATPGPAPAIAPAPAPAPIPVDPPAPVPALVPAAAPTAAAPPKATPKRTAPRTTAKVATTPAATATTSPATTPAAPGTLSLDVKPSARVYVDGAFVDETPLFQHKLAAGTHELRLVRADGSTKILSIKIEPGRPLNMKTVQW